jgi:DNA-binding MarR family transcriptional regulator
MPQVYCTCNYQVVVAIIFLRQHNSRMQEDPKYVDAWGYVLRLQSQVVARIEEDLKRQGEISLTWYDVLLTLDNSPGKRLRMSEIAERIVLSRSALTRSVDKLEAEGYLKRERCRDDERGAYAVLAKKGERALARARPVYWAGIKRYFADSLTDSDITSLERILEKIVTHFHVLSVSA